MSTDPRLSRLRSLLRDAADPTYAESHRAYHKSQRSFYGLRAAQMRTALREVFPSRQKLDRAEVLPLVEALYWSDWAEERWLGEMLLARIEPQLTPADVPLLRALADGCAGWADLDTLAITTLGPLALRLGEPVYMQVGGWSDAEALWTRRAAILVHVVPARRGKLAEEHAWPTFERHLPERDFFIRKAVGWALRECCRHYPEQVAEFLQRVGNSASGLTRREGSRKLPDALRGAALQR